MTPSTFTDNNGVPSSGRKLAWVLAFMAILILLIPLKVPALASYCIQAAGLLLLTAGALYGVAKIPEVVGALGQWLASHSAAAAAVSSDGDSK